MELTPQGNCRRLKQKRHCSPRFTFFCLERTSLTGAWSLALACFQFVSCGPEIGFSGHRIPSNRIHLSLSPCVRGFGVWGQDVH